MVASAQLNDAVSLPFNRFSIPKEKLKQLWNGTFNQAIRAEEGLEMRVLVTGGAGFVGSHLVDRLMLLGCTVTVIDDFSSGSRANLAHWEGNARFAHFELDIAGELFETRLAEFKFDWIFHLACPASPPLYQKEPVRTLKTCLEGTTRVLELAISQGPACRVLLASTSEVYGDPTIHPQPETYWGNTNSFGLRSCYDEGKRASESLFLAYHLQHGLQVRIVRIFNTYGPRMSPDDGRVVSNFIVNALRGQPLLLYGGGDQTRSFQYIHDLVSGMLAAILADDRACCHTGGGSIDSSLCMPINLGNPEEYSIGEFAQIISEMVVGAEKSVNIEAAPASPDDPQRRRPCIERAERLLGWKPTFPLNQGLAETVEYFRWQLRKKSD